MSLEWPRDNVVEYMIDALKKITKYTDLALAGGILAVLMVLLFPVVPGLLDVLLAFSIAIAIVILMNTLFINKPLELSVFPTILLVTTMLRLSLNIASTRLILANGHTGTSAAGHVIEAFGNFVMQGNVVIGLIVFLILTIINFIVITKGSGRIAEVAARFSLDAMPGKQMAIDSDLSAGLIDENTARSRRKELEEESTFYGAMDGANKFVRGDAIAGLIITFINLVGGIVIGMMQRDMPFDIAVRTYTILTIGDGLVTQIPSLVISLSAGLLVTKSGIIGSADKAIFGQLSKYPQALTVTSGVTALMSVMPGLPFFPFFILALTLGSVSYILHLVKLDNAQKEAKLSNSKQIEATDAAGDKASNLAMDQITLELGYGLLTLLNSQQGHRLADQVKALRKQMVKDYGFVMPSVRLKDNLQLPNNSYLIRVKELDTAQGEVLPDKILIMDPKGEPISIPGIDTKEPTFGLAAKWINPVHRDEALFKNYTVVDPSTVITTHLTEVVKENVTELLSYTEVQKMLDDIGEEHKKLVKDVVPDIVTISTLQKVLHNLLAESISIRDLPAILEATADAVATTKNLVSITELVRMRLARQICHAYTNHDGFIPILTLSNEWEVAFAQCLVQDVDDKQLVMPPSRMQEFVNKVKKIYDEQALRGSIPILMTSATIRPYVRSILERFRPSTAVMSQNEVHFKAKIRTLGMI
ncbi:MAG: flagellar biosynthesis protein FlhA [Pseudomonadota bacterium]